MAVAALIGAVVGVAAYSAGLLEIFAITSVFAAAMFGASLGSLFATMDMDIATPTYSFGPLANTKSQRLPVPIVYGTMRVAGNIIVQRYTASDKSSMDALVAVSEGPVASIDDILVSDKDIPALKGSTATPHFGTEAQVSDSRDPNGLRYPGTAYIGFSLKANEKLSGSPTFTSIVGGRVFGYPGHEMVEVAEILSGGDAALSYSSSMGRIGPKAYGMDQAVVTWWRASQAGNDLAGNAWIGARFRERTKIYGLFVRQSTNAGEYATGFRLEISDDGTNWETVVTYTGLTGGEVSEMFEAPVEALYARIIATENLASSAYNWTVLDVLLDMKVDLCLYAWDEKTSSTTSPSVLSSVTSYRAETPTSKLGYSIATTYKMSFYGAPCRVLSKGVVVVAELMLTARDAAGNGYWGGWGIKLNDVDTGIRFITDHQEGALDYPKTGQSFTVAGTGMTFHWDQKKFDDSHDADVGVAYFLIDPGAFAAITDKPKIEFFGATGLGWNSNAAIAQVWWDPATKVTALEYEIATGGFWRGFNYASGPIDNPIGQLYDLMTNPVYGAKIPKDRFVDETWITAAAYCEEFVNGRKRFTSGGIIDQQRKLRDWAAIILSTCRGCLVDRDGISVFIDTPVETPYKAVGLGEIVKGSFKWWQAPDDEAPNLVMVDYTDPNDHWEIVQAVFRDDDDIAVRGIVERKISAPWITNADQAQSMAEMAWRQGNLCPNFCSFAVGIGDSDIEVNDVISVTHDLPGWEGKWFRVLSVSESAKDGVFALTCSEYNPAVYEGM